MQTISNAQRRARLARRHAIAPQARVDSVEAAVAAMTCLHSTEPASVYLSSFARVDALTRDDVERALYDDRSVVKQLAMRRTVFVFARDLLPYVWGSASARVAVQQRDRIAREVEKAGITDDGTGWFDRACDQVRGLLVGEAAMSAVDLREALPMLDERIEVSPGKKYGGSFAIGPRVLTALAARGEIMRGRNAGSWRTSRPVWTSTSQWLGERAEPTDEATGYAQLVARWLRSFGPGTESDLVWWLGATRSAVRRALAALEAVEVGLDEGAVGYLLPDDLDPEPLLAPWAALLPVLDPTVMGWKERDWYLGDHAGQLFDTNGNAGQTAWWDGRVVGGWQQTPEGEVLVASLEDVGSEAVAALEVEAARLSDWLAGEVLATVYKSPLMRAHTG